MQKKYEASFVTGDKDLEYSIRIPAFLELENGHPILKIPTTPVVGKYGFFCIYEQGQDWPVYTTDFLTAAQIGMEVKIIWREG